MLEMQSTERSGPGDGPGTASSLDARAPPTSQSHTLADSIGTLGQRKTERGGERFPDSALTTLARSSLLPSVFRGCPDPSMAWGRCAWEQRGQLPGTGAQGSLLQHTTWKIPPDTHVGNHLTSKLYMSFHRPP